MKRIWPLLLLMSVYSPFALSWGEIGHETIGEIAERNLTPEARTAIVDILGPEKLAISAVWPDTIRDDPDFDRFKPYHFISVGGENKKNSLTVLKKFPDILKDREANRSMKIVALKYLVHVVGDIHQPFHVGLAEDVGGNACNVFWKPGQLSNLHTVWDSKVIEYDIAQWRKNYPPFKNYNFINYANDILKNQKLNEEDRGSIENDQFILWVKESENLRNGLYPGVAPYSYCQKDSTSPPEINEEYKKKAVLITQKRILQAGLRLANLLNSIFKNGSTPGVNTSLSKEKVLEALDFNN